MKALCKNLLIGVTGSSAAAGVPGYLSFLRRGLVEKIQVIMTESATRIVTTTTMQAYSGSPVFVDSFASTGGFTVPHIELTREADAFVIMPATANIIAKAALGIADDLLSTAIVASPGPVIIVPSMNEQMWFNRAVQRNVQQARENGYHVMEPTDGFEVTDMQPTFGAMPRLETIIGCIADRIAAKA